MEKIIFADGTEFGCALYPIETEPSLFEKKRTVSGEFRDTLRITVYADAVSAAAAFNGSSAWSVRVFEDDGVTYTDYDKSEYCVAGDIVDHRDGRVTVYMAKKLQHELDMESLERENAELLYENLTGGNYNE